MFNAATLAEGLHDAKDYGFDINFNGFTWKTLKDKRDAYIRRLNDIYSRNLDNSKVEKIFDFKLTADDIKVGEGRE